MMAERAIACTGALAANPFYFEKVYMNLYSIEELCYVLYENAFMIDKDILDIKLVDWIDKECKLPELSRELYSMLNQNVSASTFAGAILEYTGYYSKDEIDKTESILKLNVSMNVFEKWKSKGDFLFENKHYPLALKEYEHALRRMGEEDIELKSRIYNNMGVTYMALRLYESAEECFLNSYKLNNNEKAYEHYLISRRLRMPEDEYIKTITEEENSYKIGVPIETKIQNAYEAFEETDEANSLKEICELKSGVEATDYYRKLSDITKTLKRDYRDEVLEANAF